MGKRLKGYFVFTSLFYRIVMFGLMPLGVIGIGIWCGIWIGDIGLMLAAVFLPMAEILSDSWLFGGIQAKDREKMDYLKTSGRGMAVMRGALAVDLMRKFITAFTTIAICQTVILLSKDAAAGRLAAEGLDLTDFMGYGSMGREVAFGLYLVLLSFFVSALGTFLSRYGSSVYLNMMIGYGAMVLMIAGLFGPGLRGYLWSGIVLLDLLAAALGIGVSILAIKAAMKKVEDGYHDE